MEKFIISKELEGFLQERCQLDRFINELRRQEEKGLLLSESADVNNIKSHILWKASLQPELWAELHRDFSNEYDENKILNYGEISRFLVGTRSVIDRGRVGIKHQEAVRELRNLVLIWWQKWHRKI